MEPDLPPLSNTDLETVSYFRNKTVGPAFAVARRQQWPKLLKIIDGLVTKLLMSQREATAYQYLCSGLHLSGTGVLTEEQLENASALNQSQRADCIELARIYDRQRPRLMPDEPPAAGQRITAKFKPDSHVGKSGSWHTGVAVTGIGNEVYLISIAGFSLELLDDVLQWVPVLDESESDVETRQYWEQQANQANGL